MKRRTRCPPIHHSAVRFWTNNIAPEKGRIIPKHAYAQGKVNIVRNEAHDLVPSQEGVMFNTLSELLPAIEQLLAQHGVKLHAGNMERKFRA